MYKYKYNINMSFRTAKPSPMLYIYFSSMDSTWTLGMLSNLIKIIMKFMTSQDLNTTINYCGVFKGYININIISASTTLTRHTFIRILPTNPVLCMR